MSPSIFHLLVEWSDQNEAIRIATRASTAGGDINYKCEAFETFAPAEGEQSITPLRYCTKENKASLAEAFFELGARFATRPVWKKSGRHVCLLETPTTNVKILGLYFAFLKHRDHRLPVDFAETPLGLLLDEDDGVRRRVRKGFGSRARIITALEKLLVLQPGFDEDAFASVIRHGHVHLAAHCLATLDWPVERRWKGLTALHLAVLYGRPQMCSVLLKHGADPTAITSSRQLTCFHLTALMPRHPHVDEMILRQFLAREIPIDAREAVDGLTAFQIAARNQKAHLLSPFVRAGANVMLPLYDRLNILAEGRYGAQKHLSTRAPFFLENICIAGEVLYQFHQDSAYSLEFTSTLLDICLGAVDGEAIFWLNSQRTISLLHIIATILDKTAFDKLFRLARSRFPTAAHINVLDSHGDTPLHYAAAARRIYNLRVLIAEGADVFAKNNFGIAPHELMVWATIYLSGRCFKLWEGGNSPWKPGVEYWVADDERESETRRYHFADVTVVPVRSQFESALKLFERHGCVVDERLERLALAWDSADMPTGHAYTYDYHEGDNKLGMHLVPIEVTDLHVVNIHGVHIFEMSDDQKKAEVESTLRNSNNSRVYPTYHVTISSSSRAQSFDAFDPEYHDEYESEPDLKVEMGEEVENHRHSSKKEVLFKSFYKHLLKKGQDFQ